MSTNAALDDARRYLELALSDREDEARRLLAQHIERDENDLQNAAKGFVAGVASVEGHCKSRLRKLCIFSGTLAGMAAPFYVGFAYHFAGAALPCLTMITITTIVCTAVGAGIGKWISR